jgi:hypothetical protein
MFWRKNSKCDHDYEITTRGHVIYSYMGSLGVDVECYNLTKAVCVNCGYSRTLNKLKVRYANDDALLAVHRDPLGLYHGVLEVTVNGGN